MGKASSMDYARQLYVHGGADGRRITSNVELARICGLKPDSISKAKIRDKWDDEVEGLSGSLAIRNPSTSVIVAKINDKVVKLTQNISKIENFLKTLAPDDDDYHKNMQLLLKLGEQLERYNGVSQFLSVEEVYAKELAKHRAKIDAQKLTDQTEKPAKGQVVTTDGVPLN